MQKEVDDFWTFSLKRLELTFKRTPRAWSHKKTPDEVILRSGVYQKGGQVFDRWKY